MNPFGIVAVPTGVVTVTLADPTDPAGVTAVIVVGFTTVTLVARTPPTRTLVDPAR